MTVPVVPLGLRRQSEEDLTRVLREVIADWAAEDDDAVRLADVARLVEEDGTVAREDEPAAFAAGTGRPAALYGPALRLADRLTDLADPRRPSRVLAEYVADTVELPVTAEQFEPDAPKNSALITGFCAIGVGQTYSPVDPVSYREPTLLSTIEAAQAAMIRLGEAEITTRSEALALADFLETAGHMLRALEFRTQFDSG
jgi:hypothetical protein